MLPADNQLGWSFGLLAAAAGLAFAANAALRGAFSYALAAAWGFVAVTVALRVGAQGISAIGEPAVRALTKLDQVMPAAIRAHVAAVQEATVTRARAAVAADRIGMVRLIAWSPSRWAR